MVIGFGNGDYWKLHRQELDRFANDFIRSLLQQGTSALELHCRDLESLDFILQSKMNILNKFEFVSVHIMDFAYDNDKISHKILTTLENICIKHNINNVVFHTDKVISWDIIASYKKIPVSIENMDDRKDFGRTLKDVQSILDIYNFGLTLDLQHCFVNDETMQLAKDFQNKFKERIVEYHISGYKEQLLHYPLYKTKQDVIIESLIYKNIPIIIESVFDEFDDDKKELQYIIERLK